MAIEDNLDAPPRAVRHKLKEERMSVTHKFNIGGHEGYIIVGLYPDGEPGEIFIKMAKEGSTVSGLMDSFALAVSIALQHGVPLKLFCEKFAHTRFEPSGWSSNTDIGFAKSIMDYIFRWLQLRFLSGQQQLLFDNLRPRALGSPAPEGTGEASSVRGSTGNREPGTENWFRLHPCRRRPVRNRRHGRRSLLQLLRLDHDAQWELLPVHELREYEWVLVTWHQSGL